MTAAKILAVAIMFTIPSFAYPQDAYVNAPGCLHFVAGLCSRDKGCPEKTCMLDFVTIFAMADKASIIMINWQQMPRDASILPAPTLMPPNIVHARKEWVH